MRHACQSLCIDLANRPSADSQEVADGVVLDFDAEGRMVCIDIDRASQVVDLATLDPKDLPLGRLAAG